MSDEYKKAIVDMQNKVAIKRLLNIVQAVKYRTI